MADPDDRTQTTAEKVIDRLAAENGQLRAQIALRDVLLEEARAEIVDLRTEAPEPPG